MEDACTNAKLQQIVFPTRSIAIGMIWKIICFKTYADFKNIGRKHKVCLNLCQSGSDCPSNELCFSHGECLEGCDAAHHCPANSKCFKSSCLKPCNSGGKCTKYHHCQKDFNVTIYFKPQYAEFCKCSFPKLCFPNCQSNDDCLEGYKCLSNRQCKKNCQDDNDCSKSQYCDR